jgi:hypothetical protein
MCRWYSPSGGSSVCHMILFSLVSSAPIIIITIIIVIIM